MGWFIFALITLILAVIAVVVSRSARGPFDGADASTAGDKTDTSSTRYIGGHGKKDSGESLGGQRSLRVGAGAAAGVLFVLTILFTSFSLIYTQGVGQAKVIVNIDGTVAGENLDPGFGIKAPWQSFSEWDLFSQEALFAGDDSGAPTYAGGTVTGSEITSAVARGAQTNFDISVTYSLDATKVTPLYKKYRDQERFTKQVIEKSILSVVRDIPVKYTPVEFRGEKRGEATELTIKALNRKLNPYGVTIDLVNLQNVRYTAEVEEAIKQVEVSQQKEERASAELRATTIAAQTKVVEAQAEAEANAILSASLSPVILQQRALDALVKLGDTGNVVVVPQGFAGILQLK